MQATFTKARAVARNNEIARPHQADFDLSHMTREELALCLNRLLPAHREVIQLIDVASKSVEEASEIVGIPQATIRTRLFYARKALVDVVRYQGIDGVAA